MIRSAFLFGLLTVLPAAVCLAQEVPAPCVGIPSAARSPGQISIPSVSLDLPGAAASFSAASMRSLEGQFRQNDALVSAVGPRAYTGAGTERVAQATHNRILDLGPFRSAFGDGLAPLDGERWAGLYSDGDTDLLVVTESAATWPPSGVLLSPADVATVAQWLARDAVLVTIYAGKGVVQAVCDGRAGSIVRFIAPPPRPAPAMGPYGCTTIALSPSNRVAQPASVPSLALDLPGIASRWPTAIEAALLAPLQAKASQVFVNAFAAYDASPAEVARRFAGRLTEMPGWRAAYPSGSRTMLGGGHAGLFSNGQIDALLLAYPGPDFPPDILPVAGDARTRLRAFVMDRGPPSGTVAIRYEGRGLVAAACASNSKWLLRGVGFALA